jgi:hypothetical protein
MSEAGVDAAKLQATASADCAAARAVMQLTHLLSEPHDFIVSNEMWATAALIAGLRTASNESRSSRQDRGPVNNPVVDIQGVVGELIAFGHLSCHLGRWSVTPLLLDWLGGGSTETSSRADLELTIEPELASVRKVGPTHSGVESILRPRLRELIEAKCYLDIDHETAKKVGIKAKRDFAVNHEAVCTSYALGAKLMLPVAVALGQHTAVVGRCLLLSDVLQWQATEYGHRHPALAVPLSQISPVVWQAPWDELRDRLHQAPPEVDLAVLMRVHAGAAARFDELHEDSRFELDGKDLGDVIELCTPIARECARATVDIRHE